MPTEIKAHITGTIWKIPVTAGEELEEGDTMVIIESMKMEMPIEAEDDCTVLEVKGAEGQAVNEGDVILVVEDS
jgi:acetyl-CoA carboxylase biotin carboxyl carrier protein